MKLLSLTHCLRGKKNQQWINAIRAMSYGPGVKHARDAETKVTVMSNGLKVASEQRYGHYCIAGVALQSGSRYESIDVNGVSHFIERSAFKSTQKFTGREHIAQILADVGGTMDCQGSRDTLIYATSVVGKHLETAVELLGETVLRPTLSDQDVEETALRIKFENEDMLLDPERKTQLQEMIHKAAYNDNTLGLPKVCPIENTKKIDRNIMYEYMKHVHKPERMVLAGVGVDHDKLVELAQKYFVESKPIWETEASISSQLSTANSGFNIGLKSLYTGGINTVEADLSNVSLGPTPLPDLAYLQIGFEVGSHKNLNDFVIYCVLNMLLGGGGSFSAGGPGKGMFTRLFTNVLNRYYWINSSSAHNSSYDDSGIFFIQSSSPPEHLKDLADIVISEFLKVAYGRIEAEELLRAKTQLISMLWLNLEVRAVVFEDIARQVLSNGSRRHPGELVSRIEKVSAEDIRRAAQRMLTSNPSVACLGNLTNLPSYEYIKSKLSLKF